MIDNILKIGVSSSLRRVKYLLAVFKAAPAIKESIAPASVFKHLGTMCIVEEKYNSEIRFHQTTSI